MHRILALLATLALAFPLSAQSPVEFARVLLPIFFEGEVRGAHGTRWTTTVTMYNGSSSTLRFIAEDCSSPIPEACMLPSELMPGASTNVRPFRDAEVPGAGVFVHLSEPEAEEVAFTTLLRDASRSDDNAGTTLPAVREDEVRPTVVLPMVLVRGGFRVALRIYGFDERPGQVRLRMYRLDRLEPLVDELLELQPPLDRFPTALPSLPSFFGVHDLVDRWPVLEAAASVRVVVESTDGRPIWAFASQTNNDTQLVTIVAPE